MTSVELITGLFFIVLLVVSFLTGFVIGTIFMFSHMRRQLANAGIIMEKIKPSEEGEEWKKGRAKLDKDDEDWLRRNLGDY